MSESKILVIASPENYQELDDRNIIHEDVWYRLHRVLHVLGMKGINAAKDKAARLGVPIKRPINPCCISGAGIKKMLEG